MTVRGTQHLREGLSGLLDSTRRFVEGVSVYPWSESEGMEGFRQLMLRAILTKHFDSLEGLAKLVDQARGDVAVLLLRPMCEELIWLQYSLSISKEDSGILLFHMGRVSTYETFSAQKKYAESKDMGDLGFPHRVETTLTRSATDSKVEIEQLGRKLKWRIRGSQLLPTAKFIAKEVGRLEMYELLYHATSRWYISAFQS